jgi:hypothetical protein
MIKSKAVGGWGSDDANRTDVGPSIRGKTISSPIPFPDIDEFPFRGHGTSDSISREPEDGEKQLQLEGIVPNEARGIPHEGEIDSFADSRSIESFEGIPPQPSYAPPAPPTTQPNRVRISTPTAPSNADVERPKRKKSSLRAVFGRIFGKKNKSSLSSGQRKEDTANVRAGLHRSVS